MAVPRSPQPPPNPGGVVAVPPGTAMPPKAKAKGKGAAKAQPKRDARQLIPVRDRRHSQPASEPGPDTTESELEWSTNAEFMRNFEQNLQVLLDDPEYENIQTMPPLGLEEGGPGATFDQECFTTALQAQGRYEFVGNVFFQDLRWRPCPATLVNSKGVEDLMHHVYGQSPPARLNFTAVVGGGRTQQTWPHLGWNCAK